MNLGPHLQRLVRNYENEAREREGRANALEEDARTERRKAAECRAAAEYLCKSSALSSHKDQA